MVDMSQKDLNKGFTLMELLIVAAILAIISILVIPSLKGSYEQSKMNRQVDETQSFLELARQYSQSLGRQVIVSIDIKEDKITQMRIVDINTNSILEKINIQPTIRLSASPLIDTLSFSPTSSILGSFSNNPLTGSDNIIFEYRRNDNITRNTTIFYHSGAIQSL